MTDTPRPTSQHPPHSDADALPALDAGLLTALQDAQARHSLLPRRAAPQGDDADDMDHTGHQTVIVAVSGGADSVFLLNALYALRQDWQLALHVAHLDHALRADSAHDAAFVQELAAAWHLPFHHARLAPGTLEQHPDGPEAAARQARYAFLCRVARTHTPAEQTPLLAVAHHLDDQAETVLLNLARGSGLAGLAGMAWVTEMQMPSGTRPVRVIRPLLGLRRAQLRAELCRLGVTWREDASNTDARFLRNQVRQTILPALTALNPRIHATLARTAEIVAGDAARLAAWDQRTLATLTCQHVAHQRRVLDLAQFNALDWATRRGVLRQAIAGFATPDFADVAADQAITKATDKTTDTTIDARAIGFAEIEGFIESVAHAPAAPPAPGPHPLAGGLAWTYFPPTQETPAHPPRVSLHLRHVLPWSPPHPHLAQPADLPPAGLPIPLPGTLAIASGWTLVAALCAASDLPPDWRTARALWTAWLDAEQVDQLHLTTPQPGMRLTPLGLDGHSKTLGNLFTDAKIHPTLRAGWPIVQAHPPQGAPFVVWVCGLAIGAQARLTADTRQIVQLRWQPREPGNRCENP